MKNIFALSSLFIINAETIIVDDHITAEFLEQMEEIEELSEKIDNLVNKIRIEERVNTELEELNSEDTNNTVSISRPEGCCYAVPKKDSNLEGSDYNNLDFSEPACMLPSHRSNLEDINPFDTTEDQCNAFIINGTQLCSELSSRKDAKPFCVVWNDTCPWDKLLSHSSCAECTNAISCIAASSTSRPIAIWFIAAAIMVIAGFFVFIKAKKLSGNGETAAKIAA